MLKRIYNEYSHKYGFRWLADRLWSRGVSKEEAHLDEWAKVISPSNELRKWYHAHLDHFELFEEKYTF